MENSRDVSLISEAEKFSNFEKSPIWIPTVVASVKYC